jgi:SulP family sulfate permease
VKNISGIAASLFLLSFILFASKWIEMIPLAALIGVMFVVSEKTFEWGSFRLFGKVPKADILVGLTVATVTVLTDLAIAVIVGVIISALVFAWQHAKNIDVRVSTEEHGWKVYDLSGSLFFASTQNFLRSFSPREDPAEVVIDFRNARVKDHSALEAIDLLAERYTQLGKKLHLRHLSPDCLELLDKARGMIEVNVLEDPLYHPADNRLG